LFRQAVELKLLNNPGFSANFIQRLNYNGVWNEVTMLSEKRGFDPC